MSVNKMICGLIVLSLRREKKFWQFSPNTSGGRKKRRWQQEIVSSSGTWKKNLLDKTLAEFKVSWSKILVIAKNYGKNRLTVRDRRLAKRILVIKDKAVYKYPLWQFAPEVLAALDVSDFIKLNCFCKPHLSMDGKGKTPVEMLKQREIEAIVVETRAVGLVW